MANNLKMGLVHTILALHKLQWSARRIAHELGVDRATVRRHLRAAAAAGELPAGSNPATNPPAGSGAGPNPATNPPTGSAADSNPASNLPVGSAGSSQASEAASCRPSGIQATSEGGFIALLPPADGGRRNYSFFGSDNGGRTAAVLYSLIASTKRHSLDPFAYLRDVLARISDQAQQPSREAVQDRGHCEAEPEDLQGQQVQMPDAVDLLGSEQMIRLLAHWQNLRWPGGPIRTQRLGLSQYPLPEPRRCRRRRCAFGYVLGRFGQAQTRS